VNLQNAPCNNKETFTLLILCIVNGLQILLLPTNAQFYCYVFHSKLSATCFDLTAIISELTSHHSFIAVSFSNTVSVPVYGS